MSAPDTVMVLAASYPDVAYAEADYEARLGTGGGRRVRDLPAVGLLGGLAVGGGAGAAIGAVTGHMKGGMADHGLKALGEVLEQGQAGLLVVYATNMADQVAANVKAVNKYVSQESDAQADALARQLKEAEATS